MTKQLKGFTLIEFVFTLVIISATGWIIAEIIRYPVGQYIFHANHADALYMADLSFEHVFKALNTQASAEYDISEKSLVVHTASNTKHFLCQDNKLYLLDNNEKNVIAKQVVCHFKHAPLETAQKIEMSMNFQTSDTPLIFYRAFYVKK